VPASKRLKGSPGSSKLFFFHEESASVSLQSQICLCFLLHLSSLGMPNHCFDKNITGNQI
jgi:hypothetical protein